MSDPTRIYLLLSSILPSYMCERHRELPRFQKDRVKWSLHNLNRYKVDIYKENYYNFKEKCWLIVVDTANSISIL